MPNSPAEHVEHPDRASRLTRRELLFRSANGFGGLALCGLLASCRRPSGDSTMPRLEGPLKRAKSVIFLYMDGGPSQMDTFDPKPRLDREHGQPIKMETPDTQFRIGKKVMKSPYRFQQHGECGAWVSEIFPHLAECVDEMAIIRSMVSDHSEHTAANYFMNTGSPLQGRPSMGAWINYGLGSEADDLPGFVVLGSGQLPIGGMHCFGSGFLPAKYQGTLFRQGDTPVADLTRREPTPGAQRKKLGLLASLHSQAVESFGSTSELDAVIANYELAYRMQAAVPEIYDLSRETVATHQLYGTDRSETETFGRQCLLARRLVERGVRFIEVLPPKLPDHNHWDQHSNLAEHHRSNALAVDRPIAGLLRDLRSRGLLDETLVLWGGEFGRTPMAQRMPEGKDGRDHNPFGFTMWMAGGGVRGGVTYGTTDEYGYFAVENPVHVHDLHATVLHLLGLDHEQLTFRYSGRDFRLTDVAGNVVYDILRESHSTV